MWSDYCPQELDRQEQEVFSRLFDHSDTGDLSVGDAGEMSGRFGDSRPSQSETAADPTGHLPDQGQHQNQNQNQYQYNRKAHEKRWGQMKLAFSVGMFYSHASEHKWIKKGWF